MENNQKQDNRSFKEANNSTVLEKTLSNKYIDLIYNYQNKKMKQYDMLGMRKINNKYGILSVLYENTFLQDKEWYNLPLLMTPNAKISLESPETLDFCKQIHRSLKGKGVIVGIIDSGIDYTHEVFKNENNTTKIVSIWDQTIRGNPPKGYIYGTEYSRKDINEALSVEEPFAIVPSRDYIGYGTFLSGIAVGNEVDGEEFIGVAPDAELLVVRLKEAKQNLKDFYLVHSEEPVYQSTDILLGLKYLVEKASFLNRPLVIIMGIGTNQGAHDGTSITEIYMQEIARKKGNIITVAAGNEGVSSNHYRGQFDKNESH